MLHPRQALGSWSQLLTGPDEMRPSIEELSNVSETYVSCYPNAGMPDPLSPTGFPKTQTFYGHLRDYASGFHQLCWGVLRQHAQASPRLPRLWKTSRPAGFRIKPILRLSGTESYNHTEDKISHD